MSLRLVDHSLEAGGAGEAAFTEPPSSEVEARVDALFEQINNCQCVIGIDRRRNFAFLKEALCGVLRTPMGWNLVKEIITMAKESEITGVRILTKKIAGGNDRWCIKQVDMPEKRYVVVYFNPNKSRANHIVFGENGRRHIEMISDYWGDMIMLFHELVHVRRSLTGDHKLCAGKDPTGDSRFDNLEEQETIEKGENDLRRYLGFWARANHVGSILPSWKVALKREDPVSGYYGFLYLYGSPDILREYMNFGAEVDFEHYLNASDCIEYGHKENFLAIAREKEYIPFIEILERSMQVDREYIARSFDF